jgi:hypothetical protein
MTDFQPTPQTPEQVADGLRNAFRQAMKDGVMDATPYLKQMTYKSDIEKTEAEIKVLQKKLELLKEIETHKSQPRMYLENSGKFEIVSYIEQIYCRLETPNTVIWYMRKEELDGVFLKQITDGETHRLLEGVWFNEVRKGNYAEPYCPDEPYKNVRAYWDEKNNPKPVDEVVDRLIKEHQAQKLFNRLVDELGYDFDACNDVVDLVEDWILDEQSSSGSQSLDTELLVDGFNDCVRKMKEMLR